MNNLSIYIYIYTTCPYLGPNRATVCPASMILGIHVYASFSAYALAAPWISVSSSQLGLGSLS